MIVRLSERDSSPWEVNFRRSYCRGFGFEANFVSPHMYNLFTVWLRVGRTKLIWDRKLLNYLVHSFWHRRSLVILLMLNAHMGFQMQNASSLTSNSKKRFFPSDSEEPRVFDCPSSFTVELSEGESSAVATWNEPQFKDNVEITHIWKSMVSYWILTEHTLSLYGFDILVKFYYCEYNKIVFGKIKYCLIKIIVCLRTVANTSNSKTCFFCCFCSFLLLLVLLGAWSSSDGWHVSSALRSEWCLQK